MKEKMKKYTRMNSLVVLRRWSLQLAFIEPLVQEPKIQDNTAIENVYGTYVVHTVLYCQYIT